MKSALNLILLVGLFISGCSSDDVVVVTENQIEFEAICDTECFSSAFIQRDSEIIWQINEDFNGTWTKSHAFELKEGDRVQLFAMPKDGKHHIIKTRIYVDGVKQAEQDKVCHAGGGCGYSEGP